MADTRGDVLAAFGFAYLYALEIALEQILGGFLLGSFPLGSFLLGSFLLGGFPLGSFLLGCFPLGSFFLRLLRSV